jgi:SP family sugar:H+ symporter-like MFS transporter
MGPFTHITKHFNLALTKTFLIIFLSTVNYGFDNQGFNTSQAMPAFRKQFGEYDEAKHKYVLPTYWLSLFNSLGYVGFAVGVMVGSLVSARWGRRMGMFVMSCWVLIPTAIVLSSTSKWQILAGRALFCK